MKPKHVAAESSNARAVLTMCKIEIGQNYLTLRPTQVEALRAEADRIRYQKPPTAKGARARHFHDLIQRRARGLS